MSDAYERLKRATHAYVGVYGGIVQMMCADCRDERTANDVAEVIRSGGEIHRVPISETRALLFQPWPPAEEPGR